MPAQERVGFVLALLGLDGQSETRSHSGNNRRRVEYSPSDGLRSSTFRAGARSVPEARFDVADHII
jgi:hypothetical protein